MSTTVVTSLYDIGRSNLEGEFVKRSFDTYLQRFKHLLAIDVPMIIFIPKKLQEFVQIYRKDYPTKIIVRKFKDLSAYKYHDKMQDIINNVKKGCEKDYNRYPEFVTSKYETVIFSKFDFLKEAAEENPFKTDYFIWMDAGAFYNKTTFNISPWPDPYKISILGDKFLIPNISLDPNNKTSNKKEYLRNHDNKICCYIMGGKKDIINKVHSDFWKEVNNAIELNVINNEQILLQLVIQQHPQDYFLWSTKNHKYDLIESPTKDRMIPYELAYGTFMTQKFNINPNIKLLTIATKEIKPKHYFKWETSAKYYGYNYEVIGKDTKWSGFNTKIKLCIDKLKTVKEEYTLITDCTDVFFCGCSNELYDKLNKDVIVGSELRIWYNGGKYSHKDLYLYFNDIKQSEQKFPNGGFIIGKTVELIKVMELISEYKDDQVGYFDIIYDKRYPLSLDYETKLVGNIPNYKDHLLSPNYFVYDKQINRYKNKFNDETPVALHFPGGNFYYMQEYYNTVNSELENDSLQGEYLAIFFIVLIISLLVILLFYYIF
jgi:hypothetical protein